VLQRRHTAFSLRRATRIVAHMAGLVSLTLLKLDERVSLCLIDNVADGEELRAAVRNNDADGCLRRDDER
jgi:hypothetical protein